MININVKKQEFVQLKKFSFIFAKKNVLKKKIYIRNASENNLRNITLEIPKNKLVVVTGVSGSGKSSLVHDVIYREAENRYLGSFSSYARQYMGKMKKPEVEKLDGLSPAIAVTQRTAARNPRSTVGTMTGIYDYLRLLFARLGKSDREDSGIVINRHLFSFNSPAGACPKCKGLGVEDRLDPALLIADENKTLRQGALVITTPSGYIIYSQVTMDVLNRVCESEGFNVDIPWKDLTEEQKRVVLYGSDKIEIPYGKHTLESRMRWSGITAKPRETGFYKGIIPVMETILKRERNKNILRFVRTEQCSVCGGARLNGDALSVKWHGQTIAALARMSVVELGEYLAGISLTQKEHAVAAPVIEKITRIVTVLEKTGTGHLSVDRVSTTLSGGEMRRLHLATQVTSGLSGVLYVFDEPSIGLHAAENQKMLEVLRQLRDLGNTVLVVEHEDDFIRNADHVIDLGPGAGIHGGSILLNTAIADVGAACVPESRTLQYLKGTETFALNETPSAVTGILSVKGAAENNLQNIDADFSLKAFNVVTGVSGAGKSSLVLHILSRFLQRKLHGSNELPGKFRVIEGWEVVKKVISIDQSPIGRTPRSNPATYTKLSDRIRDLFASLPESKERGWGKGRFSFNVAGGRCETCQGAGYIQTGMHFMGNVETLCETCNGKRFNNETLAIRYRGLNISEVLELSVEAALVFFAGLPKLVRILQTLEALGLGYLKLGQRSTTLSGGEAQRIKLAAELSRPGSAHTLYILDEPTTGLHNADVKVLLNSLKELTLQGNTVVVIEHHPGIISAADHIIDLGPSGGHAGGKIVAQGEPRMIMEEKNSPTGMALKRYHSKKNGIAATVPTVLVKPYHAVSFKGITTHNLKNIDVSFPHQKVTVVTGVSGSGKSSLVFDTLYAAGRNRFLDSFSPYIRSRIGMQSQGDFEEVTGLTPTLSINRRTYRTTPRSTVGTLTGIYDLYRLLFSRAAVSNITDERPYSSLFSFNHRQGACPACDGLGEITVCDPDKLITNPEKPLADGAMNGHKTGKFYGDPNGQYIAVLYAAGEINNMDFTAPWIRLDNRAKELAMYGTGDRLYDVVWKFKRGKNRGEHRFKTVWKGFVNLVNEEYRRKHADHRGEEMLPLMKQQVCPSCGGARLNDLARSYMLAGKNISQLAAMSVDRASIFFGAIQQHITDEKTRRLSVPFQKEILRRLEALSQLGLGYLSADRSTNTLSGGELQRVRLAALTGNELTDITIVIDEPTVGLHPVDTENLMKVITGLRNKGNTVVMVEHDLQVMESADRLIEIGPGAGMHGGKIIATGTPETLAADPNSVTGVYLFKKNKSIRPSKRKLKKGISIEGAFAHNLKNLDVQIPSGGIIAVTGVSGSGKSTLLFDVIARSWRQGRAVGCKAVSGLEHFDELYEVTQKPVATGPTSNIATFSGIFGAIRDIFAKTPQARKSGLTGSHFSLSAGNGRCEHCQGAGKVRISMDFISDVWVTCEVCGGKRYRNTVLDITFNGKNINDVLEMTVSEAKVFFEGFPKLSSRLSVIEETGLGYLKPGQATDTLSGGEIQRLKLAKELMNPKQNRNLYLMDEPTTGLHPFDIKVILGLFDKLGERGNTLLIIEHNKELIRSADWVIDLGPGGGEAGGALIAAGTPEHIMNNKSSVTGKYLK